MAPALLRALRELLAEVEACDDEGRDAQTLPEGAPISYYVPK